MYSNNEPLFAFFLVTVVYRFQAGSRRCFQNREVAQLKWVERWNQNRSRQILADTVLVHPPTTKQRRQKTLKTIPKMTNIFW